MYGEWVRLHPNYYSASLHRMTDLARSGKLSQQYALAQEAWKDSDFRGLASEKEVSVDPVQYEYWQTKTSELDRLQEKSQFNHLGINSDSSILLSMFSYQFLHGNFWHFFSNMCVFLLVGLTLEAIVGSWGLLLLYLGGGAIAGLTYVVLSGVSPMPLVGASGSICFLLAVLCVITWGKKMNYFYFLMPMCVLVLLASFFPKQKRGDYNHLLYGFIKFPAYYALIYWWLGDFAGFVADSATLGQVAYGAHLGGLTFGAIVGLTLRYFPTVQLKSSEVLR
jgi:membrane associated rhomboid family serine protease